jgi:hypothetical protein
MTSESKPDEPVTDPPNQKKAATGDYSATKAPENQPHVESTAPTTDPRLMPGGPHGTPHDVGMSGLYRETIPSQRDLEDQDEDKKTEEPGS